MSARPQTGHVAAFAFAQLCGARGWTHVRIHHELLDVGPGVSVDATSPTGRYHLVVAWHRRRGPARFAGAGFLEKGASEAVRLATADEATRLVEEHGVDERADLH